MNRADIDVLLQRWTREAIANGKVEVFDELLTEDVLDESAEAATRGRTPFKARAEGIRRTLRELVIAIDALVVDGNSIAWRWTLTGLDARGDRVQVRGANFQTLEGGRVATHWSLRS